MSSRNRGAATGFLRVSPVNIVIIVLALLGALACGLTAHWLPMALLIVTAAGVLVFALAATNPDAPTLLRVNSFQYRDDRDREIARHGFAAVGMVALPLALAEAIAAAIFGPDWLFPVAALQLAVLTLLFSRANARAARE